MGYDGHSPSGSDERAIMAKATQEVAQTETQVVGFDADGIEWQTVHTEQPDQITFDTIGDTLVAIYLGQQVIEFENKRVPGDGPSGGQMQEFTQLMFMLPGNNPAVVNAGYDLLVAFKNVPTNRLVRVQYLKDVDVDQQSPMKSYRVDVAPAA
jgi:hypothetical protein